MGNRNEAAAFSIQSEMPKKSMPKNETAKIKGGTILEFPGNKKEKSLNELEKEIQDLIAEIKNKIEDSPEIVAEYENIIEDMDKSTEELRKLYEEILYNKKDGQEGLQAMLRKKIELLENVLSKLSDCKEEERKKIAADSMEYLKRKIEIENKSAVVLLEMVQKINEKFLEIEDAWKNEQAAENRKIDTGILKKE